MPCHSRSTRRDDLSELQPSLETPLPLDLHARAVTRTAFAILLVLLALWVASGLRLR